MQDFYPFALLSDSPRDAVFVSISGNGTATCQMLPATGQIKAKGLAVLTKDQATLVFKHNIDALGGQYMDVAARVMEQFGEEKLYSYLEFQSLAGMRDDYLATPHDERKLWFSGLKA